MIVNYKADFIVKWPLKLTEFEVNIRRHIFVTLENNETTF